MTAVKTGEDLDTCKLEKSEIWKENKIEDGDDTTSRASETNATSATNTRVCAAAFQPEKTGLGPRSKTELARTI